LKKKIPMAAGRPYLIVFAVLTTIEFLPVMGTGDLTAHYNTHAINLSSKGFGNDAIKYWQESSAMNRPYSAYANLSLAGLYYQRNDFSRGNFYLNKIPDDSFAAAGKYELLGNGLLKQQQIDQAISAFEKSLQINSGQLKARRMLIRLYEYRNPQQAVKEKEHLAYIESFYKEVRGL
jgi:tetratricopeptide (TPR) repeat protein